ncbi:NAD(P)H-dependent oxidoreductase [Sutterella megalosphaeroides]|uniref:NADPH quinone reductase MdaB n=1 Tax=Sutterella megalosphaeroides TaxID=2494234 RepID=A0A2Z6IA71_9BURK|nr:NAD(P)H-dependent oxidoreductase [Sutterella megalosphaeroides]BBF23411.1 NADPH quinone reductase MdaB [Sutterella megalosphaeroides]
MTRHALFIDAGCTFGHSQGGLSHAFVDLGRRTLESLGWTTDVTRIDDGWVVEDEVRKILAARLIVIQTPGWWMSTPWKLKKYQDEVFVMPELCGGDGRSRHDPSKLYGSGGFLTDKHYLLSSTWNAPLEAFEDPKQFFGGVSIDGVFLPLHRTMAFLGLKALPSFMANDVIKNPQIDADMKRFVAHLEGAVKDL